MKAFGSLVVLAAALLAGCDPAAPAGPAGVCSYAPARIHIVGLTRVAPVSVDGDESALKAYVDLLDAFDSHIKAPGKFRFELYEFLPRSPEPRGKRLMIWPDIDLTAAEANNGYWQDYLRTYQFTLDMGFRAGPGSTFILEATCITPASKNLIDRRQIYCRAE